jgi:hypothetical protein
VIFGEIIIITPAFILEFISLYCFYANGTQEAYEVHLGSEDGIIIPKTQDPKADQLTICKAAKEIEARCHEIANKRRELDHIAESCK